MVLSTAVVDGDPVAAARAVALDHADDSELGIRRRKRGKSFRYVDASGRPVRDADTLSRIRALAIPPAWTDVWISPNPDGHIQATGRDARGRKQYRYHARWRAVRDEAKFYRLVDFCRALPKLREAVATDLACACLCKRKVVATIVSLMERAQLRVGNDEYARANKSYGATTLQDRHAKIEGDKLVLSYRGKSGIERRVKLTDRRLARIVRSCRELPGQRLFQYVEGDAVKPVTSSDVNDYLREVTGGPFTAKDYRTWAATLGAALLLCWREHPDDERGCKKCINEVLGTVAERLGHTVAVCRSSYVHPRVLDDFQQGKLDVLARMVKRRCEQSDAICIDALIAIEPVVVRYLGETLVTRRRRHA